ncbi:hypothetical protein Plhal304r1_c048g0130091 [Plasmopara halstedii]
MARVSCSSPRLSSDACRGISFVCTSYDALTRLGNLQVTVCGISVMICKKCYRSSDLRLICAKGDQTCSDYSYARACSSEVQGTHFNSAGCPAGLFESTGEPLQDLHFDSEEEPCFVQHRLRKFNWVKPPSLRPHPRRSSDTSDASMNGR